MPVWARACVYIVNFRDPGSLGSIKILIKKRLKLHRVSCLIIIKRKYTVILGEKGPFI